MTSQVLQIRSWELSKLGRQPVLGTQEGLLEGDGVWDICWRVG